MKTKINILLLTVGLLLTACSTSKTMLDNRYAAQKSFTIQQDFDHVWDNVIDFFAENGIMVTNVEKASGFITANQVVFTNNYTVENKNDKRYNPNAYFVIPNVKFDKIEITANFNVRVRKNDDNTVTVSINLPNLKGEISKKDIWIGRIITNDIEVASTGVFEQMLFDMFSM